MSSTTLHPRRGRRIMDPDKREAFKAERRQEDRERIEAAVRELTESDGWRRWVETRSRFHDYSLSNQLLIALQSPDATRVAGYRTWQSVGRQVRRGEKGIRILAPMAVKARKCDTRQRSGASTPNTVAQQVAANRRELYDARDDDAETRMLFRSVSVFDVEQTDGEPLPEPPVEPIEGDSHAEHLPQLVGFAESIGFAVAFEPVGHGADGYCDQSGKRIVVESSHAPNRQVRTLVHELAHALGVSYRDYGRATAEVIVESAAMIVTGSLGLDTAGMSIPYLAGWGHGDVQALREYAGKVDELASRIESALGVK